MSVISYYVCWHLACIGNSYTCCPASTNRFLLGIGLLRWDSTSSSSPGRWVNPSLVNTALLLCRFSINSSVIEDLKSHSVYTPNYTVKSYFRPSIHYGFSPGQSSPEYATETVHRWLTCAALRYSELFVTLPIFIYGTPPAVGDPVGGDRVQISPTSLGTGN